MNTAVKWFSTSKDAYWQEQKLVETAVAKEKVELQVTSDTFQQVEGFGGCFNELGYIAMQQLTEEERKEIFYQLFHPDGAHKYSICRLPIGASDYAAEWYSHNEHDGDYAMEHFSIERDFKYLLPYIKEALSYNPNLKLFASPWSPPTWMKSPKAYNYGTLRWEKEVLEAYALYLVKFVEAYRAEGITIHQLHVQNEVIADQKFPSCVWTGEQLREFIGDYLGPAFEHHQLDTEIWLGTINAPEPWEELMGKDSTDHSNYAHLVLSDPKAYRYISGVGYQWAGKHAIQRTVASYPELRYMQTENECGDGKNSWGYAHHVFQLFQHYFFNGVNSYIYWNMTLEPKGKSTWGWEQNSLITIVPEDKQVIKNPEYYVMQHFSHFVSVDSVRRGVKGSWTGNTIAFATPDNKLVVVFANPWKKVATIQLSAEGKTYELELPAESFHTIVMEG